MLHLSLPTSLPFALPPLIFYPTCAFFLLTIYIGHHIRARRGLLKLTGGAATSKSDPGRDTGSRRRPVQDIANLIWLGEVFFEEDEDLREATGGSWDWVGVAAGR